MKEDYRPNLNSLLYSPKRNQVDFQWLEVKEVIWKRDKTCRIWACLTAEEKKYVIKNFKDDYEFLRRRLDICHIIPRSQSPELYYDPTNLVLGSRYFHTMLDTLQCPITRKSITSEERLKWFIKARDFKEKIK